MEIDIFLFQYSFNFSNHCFITRNAQKLPNSIAKAFGHLQPYEDVGQPAVFDREYYFYLMLIHLSIKICRSQTDTQYVIFLPPPLSLIPRTVKHILYRYTLFVSRFLKLVTFSISSAVDSDSPSSPHLKRGIRMVR